MVIFRKKINEDLKYDVNIKKRIPHIEKIKILKDRENIIDLIKNDSNLKKIENSQIRRLCSIASENNYNLNKINEYINHQLERITLKEETKKFYINVGNIIKNKNKEYIKTYFYEILLYKKSLKGE